jgi:FKBP-type peptidyl-prolyl cis-trans isomerase SlyD
MSDETTVIGDDRVVTFHYRVRDAEKTFEESSDGRDPLVYLHGHSNIVPGLETAMVGKGAGEKFSVTVAPERGYGQRDPQALRRVSIKHLATPGPLKVGQYVAVNTREGHRQALVVKVGHFNVDLDLNHPLAGKTLEFDIEILTVRSATDEELAHGHAHGPGGHGHDHGEHGHDHDDDHDH